jgi:hypothetical protein
MALVLLLLLLLPLLYHKEDICSQRRLLWALLAATS